MLCAGHAGKSKSTSCHGDSGGAFACKTGRGDSWELHGVVSWGSGNVMLVKHMQCLQGCLNTRRGLSMRSTIIKSVLYIIIFIVFRSLAVLFYFQH